MHIYLTAMRFANNNTKTSHPRNPTKLAEHPEHRLQQPAPPHPRNLIQWPQVER